VAALDPEPFGKGTRESLALKGEPLEGIEGAVLVPFAEGVMGPFAIVPVEGATSEAEAAGSDGIEGALLDRTEEEISEAKEGPEGTASDRTEGIAFESIADFLPRVLVVALTIFGTVFSSAFASTLEACFARFAISSKG